MNPRLLREGKYTDLAIVLYLAKKFVTPFKRWKAFDLDIIDEKGNILKKKLKTREEKNSFTHLDRFILKMRKLVGDHLFLKLGVTALILAGHEEDGMVIEEKTDGTDKAFLQMIKEEVLSDTVEINVPLEGRAESIKMDFEKTDGRFSFSISVFLGNDMASTIGGNFLPTTDSNKEFFKDLNSVFSDMTYGDNKNLFIDLGSDDITVNVNYGENEIKMSQQTDSNDIHADFYMLFGSDKERQEFLKGWAKYYEAVSTQLDI